MLPKWHVLLGVLFGLFLWLVWPQIGLIEAITAFLASFLIDLDHYLAAAYYTGKWKLSDIFEHYEKRGRLAERMRMRGIKMKDYLQIFHTVEFHILILIIGLYWKPALYAFAGMIFHSFIDLIWQIKKDVVYAREYFFIIWLIEKIS